MSPMGSDGAANLVEVRDLDKSYGDRYALRDFSLDASAGELVAVIGPNGAGKTTLLACLAGIVKPDSGSIFIGCEKIGWVPQQQAIYRKLTVAENLRLFAHIEAVADIEAAVQEMLLQTDLVERADDLVEHLSGGNIQRVNIATGVLGKPKLLLLDEPTASLDPRQREVTWQFVKHLADSGTSVIYTTHYVDEAEKYADRVVVIADGELLFSGQPAALRSETAELADGVHSFGDVFVSFLRSRGH